MPSAPSSNRVDIVNALRAFAAIFVAWGHFSIGQGRWLNWSGKYGYTGVYIFFVISGFIIPYSLYRGGYTLRSLGRFMLKRGIRLYPPYLISIPVSILAANLLLRPLAPDAVIHLGGRQLFYHLLFLNDLAGMSWVNVVYWTLAIEWQWYLLAGLAFPLLVSRNPLARFLPVALAMVSYFLCTSDRVVPHTLPIFLIGVFVFQEKIGLIGRGRMLALTAAMLWAMRWPTGWLAAGISVATGLVIAFVPFRHRLADFLGDVSYSLYLLHLPIGVTLIGWLSHLLPYSGTFLGVLDLAGMLGSIGAAALLYRWVEKPAQETSSRLRFVREERRDAALAAAAAK
ncbi:MAG TPA: acyltransferase [Candidatus Angelobacter sp.]|nr:acyltransferase [Candidatus Angelobacter sp.]